MVSPSCAGASCSMRSNTKNSVALLRLPTSRNTLREISSASGGSAKATAVLSRIARPPGWTAQRATSANDSDWACNQPSIVDRICA